VEIGECLTAMGLLYRTNPITAVRGQGFIKELHEYLISGLEARLSPAARRRGVKVVPEAWILGSHKPKNVDVAVVDPQNGPLILIGVRSQMSSVGKNALNYYEGIVGECISLQDRYPMAVHGYVYLMPSKPIMAGREQERIDHRRYARMYAAVTGRTGQAYKNVSGVFDQFAYVVVDFDSDPPAVNDDLVREAVEVDLSIGTFVDRIIRTFQDRMLFWDVFE